MRILMTTDTVGGVWTYTRELVMGLLQADRYTRIFLFAVGANCSVEQLGWLRAMRERNPGRFEAAVHVMPLEWEQCNDEVDPAEPRLLSIAHSFAPDILHSNQFCYGALPLRCPRLVVAHSDVFSWHREVYGAPPEPSPWLDRYAGLVRDGISGAKALVAPTRWMLGAFRDGFGLPALTRVIPNGIGLRADLSYERRLQAVTAGRLWDAGKNVAMLQELLAPAIPVLVAGAARYADAALEWQGSSQVELLGALNHRDLLNLFAHSAIYLSTARYEPFGLSPLEAARSGCAVLSLDLPSMREVWNDAALYFHTANELAEILQELAGSPEVLAKAQRRALATSRQYTREGMTDSYRQLYRELIDAPRETLAVA